MSAGGEEAPPVLNPYTDRGLWFDDVVTGQKIYRRFTVTETHLVLACGIFGDMAPLHVDEVEATEKHGGRIFPGPYTVGLMAGSVAETFAGTAIADTDLSFRFTYPVYPGDTLSIVWEVLEREDQPRKNRGLLRMSAVADNQDGRKVAEASMGLLVRSRSGATT
jgi:3-hydroxybutyryl-CoA dehydratase